MRTVTKHHKKRRLCSGIHCHIIFWFHRHHRAIYFVVILLCALVALRLKHEEVGIPLIMSRIFDLAVDLTADAAIHGG